MDTGYLNSGMKALLLIISHGVLLAQERPYSSDSSSVLPDKKPYLSDDQNKAHARNHHMMAFREVDTNHDRKLAFSEFKQLKRLQNMEEGKQRRLFDFLDLNQDGHLDMREVHVPKRRWAASGRREFHHFDINRDGSLSLVEFSAFLKASKTEGLDVAKSFERLDQNSDGKIERYELVAKISRFASNNLDFSKHDVDGNGGLVYAEYTQIPWVVRLPDERRKKLFERIDADDNGEISIKEIGTMHRDKRRLPGYSPLGRGGKGGGLQRP